MADAEPILSILASEPNEALERVNLHLLTSSQGLEDSLQTIKSTNQKLADTLLDLDTIDEILSSMPKKVEKSTGRSK